MLIYTSLLPTDIKQISNTYQIEIHEYKAAGEGSGNSNYILETDKGTLLLSIIEEQSFEEVEVMAKVLQWLEKQGFYTSKLISTAEGKPVITCKGKPTYLKNYLPGKVVKSLSLGQLEQVGSTLAKLHQLPAPDYLPDEIYFNSPVFREAIGSGIEPDYEAWLEERLTYLEANLPTNVPRGMIHGDLFFDNMLFDGEELVAFIDFELACHYYKVFDIGMTIIGTCANEQHELAVEKAKALIAAYESIRPLEALEKASLQNFTELAAIRVANWRFWRYRYFQPNPDKATKHLEMRRLAEDIAQKDWGLLF